MSGVVGFVGAGHMGEPMVDRLLAAGHDVHLHARRDEVRERLGGRGAVLTDSIAELAAGSDVLISCLFDDAQLEEIGLGPNGLAANAKPGAIFISHTTGRVSTLEAIKASARDLHVLDGPVSGTDVDISKGDLTVLIGGPDSAVDVATAVIGAYAKPIIPTGGLGTALRIKLVNNLLFAANIQMLGAAVDLAERLGVQEDRLLAALRDCSGGSRAGAYMQQYGGAKILAAGIGPVISKDVAACESASAEAGVDLGLLAKIVEAGPFTWESRAS